MQFQSTSRSVLGQFQVIFRGVSDKVQKCFRAVSGQFQGSFRAIAEQFEVVPRSRNQRASVTGFQEFKNGALLQNGIQNLHINHSFKLTYAGRFGGGRGRGCWSFWRCCNAIESGLRHCRYCNRLPGLIANQRPLT